MVEIDFDTLYGMMMYVTYNICYLNGILINYISVFKDSFIKHVDFYNGA